MLDWKKLYNKKGKNNKLVGSFFEELALTYLSSTYKQYSWKATQSSWDGNRDFTTLILDNIWGEAKYKKDSSALRRQGVAVTAKKSATGSARNTAKALLAKKFGRM